MSKRICSKPGCPTIVDKAGPCAIHKAEAEAKRGTFAQRGYDARHRREGKQAKRQAVEQTAICPRCNKPILAGQPLQFGHSKDRALDPEARADRVEHASCGSSAGATLGNLLRSGRDVTPGG